MSLAVLAACGPTALDGDDGDDRADGGRGGADPEFVDARFQAACDKMDLVFVIDNSGSMYEEQDNLGANFPRFIELLDGYRNPAGDPLDYRIAITTTGRDVDYTDTTPFTGGDVHLTGDNGAFRTGCGMTQPWMSRGDVDVAGTFACLASVGTEGPSMEMPLVAAELALIDRMQDGTNAGFLRSDENALLGLVILTDEDDCSRNDNDFTIHQTQCGTEDELVRIEQTLEALDAATGDRRRWAAAVVAGPGPGSCSSSFGQAVEAVRLRRFVDDIGDNAVFSSICAGDLTVALEDAIHTFESACESFPAIP